MDNELVILLSSCACAVVFLILLLQDVIMALKKKALWIPAETPTLSALTIQLISLIDYSHVTFMGKRSETKKEVEDMLGANQLVIDSARLMMCVFLSYLVPQMVRSRWKNVWTDIGALVLAVMFHLGVELYFVWKIKFLPRTSEHYLSKWFMLSSIILFIDSALLLLLLTCAAHAGKSIRKVMAQKVPSALSCCESNCPEQQHESNCPEQQRCKNIEDHILKCWIVTRASQPDYIMARSVFSALAGLLVLVPVVIVVIKWTCIHFHSKHGNLRKITVAVEFAFALVGCLVVLFRWFTSVIYFPKNVQLLFYMEDFWTRSIAEMKEDLDTQSESQLYMKKRIRELKLVEKVMVFLVTKFRLQSFSLPMRIWLQKVTVYLSKVCWSLSEFAVGMLRPLRMSREKNALLSGLDTSGTTRGDHKFSQYKEALDIIRMRGEVAYSLWRANNWAFNQTENHMKQGIEKGKGNTEELVKLIRHKTGTVEDGTTSLVLEEEMVLEEEKHFKYLGKKSWKMRATSLIYCMIYDRTSDKKDVINDAIQACSQAWDFMDIIDRSDEEAKLVSLAADKAFYALLKTWNEDKESVLEHKPFKEDMEQLSKDGVAGESQKYSCVESLHDSKAWMRSALRINLYKTWKSMEGVNADNRIENLQSLLAKIIVHCIDNEIDSALRNQCNEWAKKGMETKIQNAAFIAGKLKGVREQAKMNGESEGARDEIREGNVICQVDRRSQRPSSSLELLSGGDNGRQTLMERE